MLDADDNEKPAAEMAYCKGALLFMKKNFKRPVDKKLAALVAASDPKHLDNILNAQEFIEHHTLKYKK